MYVRFTEKFRKQYNTADVRIRNRFDICLEKFIKNPLDLELRNHELHGALQGFKSIDITGDWRAVFSETTGGEIIFYFAALGTHAQLYK